MANDKPLAVILLSGGMDSTVCAAEAIAAGYEVAALHMNYGQRTQERERKAFNDVCDAYGVEKRLEVDTRHFAVIGGSSLTDMSIPVEEAKLGEETEIPSSYVPFRNAIILALATGWAEVLGARALYIGAVEEDSSGYPDCRGAFFDAFQKVVDLGTKPDTAIAIKTPILHKSKAAIVRRGVELGAPLHLTWSCYSESERACGHCDSCALRLRGFYRAGLRDPIDYADEAARDMYR